MNYIKHLNAFYAYVRSDKRLTAYHISVYMALFQCWNANRFKNPFVIGRDEVIKLSAIGSKNTYYKSLKDLHDFGYIFYKSSENKFYKSSVYIVVFENSNPVNMQQLNLFVSTSRKNENPAENIDLGLGQYEDNTCPIINTAPVPYSVQDKENVCTKNDTVPVPYLSLDCPIINTVPVPYMGLLIKHKHINSKREREANSLTQNLFSKNDFLQKGINGLAAVPINETQLSSSPSPSGEPVPTTCREGLGVRPSMDKVLAFFSENNYPAPEAHKFFNHYQSNGWLVAGKTPMIDWKSSANKWMLNTSHFKTAQKPTNGNHEQRDIDTGPGKNYSQPL